MNKVARRLAAIRPGLAGCFCIIALFALLLSGCGGGGGGGTPAPTSATYTSNSGSAAITLFVPANTVPSGTVFTLKPLTTNESLAPSGYIVNDAQGNTEEMIGISPVSTSGSTVTITITAPSDVTSGSFQIGQFNTTNSTWVPLASSNGSTPSASSLDSSRNLSITVKVSSLTASGLYALLSPSSNGGVPPPPPAIRTRN